MKTILSLVAASVMFVANANAQERAAAGTVETQMTWSALKDLVESANAKSDAVNARVNQVVVCGKKTMLYGPGAKGTDGDGCLPTGGEYKGPLLAGSHTGDDCLDSGGRPKSIGNGYICVFGGGSCQLGWSSYSNWTATQKTICKGSGNYGSACQTLAHSFGNSAAETCTYGISVAHGAPRDSALQNTDPGKATCSAQAILRGCI